MDKKQQIDLTVRPPGFFGVISNFFGQLASWAIGIIIGLVFLFQFVQFIAPTLKWLVPTIIILGWMGFLFYRTFRLSDEEARKLCNYKLSVSLIRMAVIFCALLMSAERIPQGVMQYATYVPLPGSLNTVILVLAFCFAVIGVLYIQYGNPTSEHKDFIFVLMPSLAYGLLVFAVLHNAGPIRFVFLVDVYQINNSIWFSLGISLVWFAGEFLGNTVFVKEKRAYIKSFGGRRTGSSATEGVTFVPGILPLLFQVPLYAIFRFSPFGDVQREISMSPVIFQETIIAYSKDNKAMLFSVGCRLDIADAYEFDNALDDTQADESMRRAPVIAQAKQFVALVLGDAIKQRHYDYLQEHVHEGKRFHLTSQMKGDLVNGLQLSEVMTRFTSFADENLQRMFQSYAGGDIRESDVLRKEREVATLFATLKKIDASYTLRDAERLWENFTKSGRGSFRYTFI